MHVSRDIHHGGGNEPDSVINARARAARATAARTTGGASYNDAFNKRVSSVKFCGKRLLTNFLPEITSPLEQEDALGHRLYVAGVVPQQYIYCELCNAYTGVRAQNLMTRCRGQRYRSQAVNRLRKGRHPEDDTDLATQPRRLTRMDVGADIWNGNPPCELERDCEGTRSELCSATPNMDAGVVHNSAGTHPQHLLSSLSTSCGDTEGTRSNLYS